MVRYIDANPIQARLASQPWHYPHGSAARFASGRVPRWLSTDWILGDRRALQPAEALASYAARWGQAITVAEHALVELRIRGRGVLEDDLDDLVGTAPDRVRAWMIRKARLADNTRPGQACVPPQVVLEVVDRLRVAGRVLRHRTPGDHCRDAWGIATAGLLRHMAAQTHSEIAKRLGISNSMVTRRVRAHAQLMEDGEYATRLGRVATLCLQTAFPGQTKEVRNRP